MFVKLFDFQPAPIKELYKDETNSLNINYCKEKEIKKPYPLGLSLKKVFPIFF